MNSQVSNFSKGILMLAAFAFSAALVAVCSAGARPERESVKITGEGGSSSTGFYDAAAGSSKVVLTVDGMSCSGCISTIKSSLSEFEGINEVLVDVVGGKAEIYFDDKKLKDVGQIAAAITASGYSAKIDRIVPASEVKKELRSMASRSRLYVASVGDLDISRDDLDKELAYAKKRYSKRYGEGIFSTDRGKLLLNNVKAQIVSRLIDEGIQLQEIQKTGFEVDKATVEQEFSRFLAVRGQTLEEFKKALEENGSSSELFMKRFETQVLVRQYLDKEILTGVSNRFERSQRYTNWFNNARLLAKVVYFDKDLEVLVKNQSGNSGCSRGGSCSAKDSSEKGSCCSSKPGTK